MPGNPEDSPFRHWTKFYKMSSKGTKIKHKTKNNETISEKSDDYTEVKISEELDTAIK
jgi:hypothetical protein